MAHMWRCLWEFLPTTFFDQSILLLRKLQRPPSPSRINGKYGHLGFLTNWPQFISWDISYYTPSLPSHLLCFRHTRILSVPQMYPSSSHTSLFRLQSSHSLHPVPVVIILPLFVYKKSAHAVQPGSHIISPFTFLPCPPSRATPPNTVLRMLSGLRLDSPASLSYPCCWITNTWRAGVLCAFCPSSPWHSGGHRLDTLRWCLMIWTLICSLFGEHSFKGKV